MNVSLCSYIQMYRLCFERLNHVSGAWLFTYVTISTGTLQLSNLRKLQHGFWLLTVEFPLRVSVWDSLKYPCFLIDIRLPPGCTRVFALPGCAEKRRLVFSWTIRSCLDVGHDRFIVILSNYSGKGRTTPWVQRILNSALAGAECPVFPSNGFNTE